MVGPVAISPSASPADLFLANLPLVERLSAAIAHRHHLSDADDFASFVKLALIDDDYAVLRKFQGRSSLKTFLSVVIGRLLLDYRIKAWGKWRPSAEAKQSGDVAVLLEQLLARDGHTFAEAYEMLVTNHRVTLTRDAAEQLAASLPVRFRRRIEPEEALADLPAASSADAALFQEEYRVAALAVFKVLAELLAELDPQDRLILTLRFTDGRQVSDIAQILGLEAKPLYRRVEGLLRRLRQALETRGLSAADVSELLRADA